MHYLDDPDVRFIREKNHEIDLLYLKKVHGVATPEEEERIWALLKEVSERADESIKSNLDRILRLSEEITATLEAWNESLHTERRE